MILQLKKKSSLFDETWYFVSVTDREKYKCLCATTDEEKANAEYAKYEALLQPGTVIGFEEILKTKEV